MANEARSHPPDSRFSLGAVVEGAEAPLPDFAAAGVPLAVVAAMSHAEIDIRYMDFAAASGWAFSFGYDYRDETPAHMAVQGDPDFDGTVRPGWIDVGGLQPHGVYCFVRTETPRPPSEITRASLARALSKGREHLWRTVPQGLGALRRFLADLLDPAKDFSECPSWLGWAALERLMARRCAEVWLRAVAANWPGSGEAGRLLGVAADRYGEAFRAYDRFWEAIQRGQGHGPEGTRAPETRQAAAPFLEQGIAEEAAGLSSLESALDRRE